MNLFRTGNRIINLDYLIMLEYGTEPPESLRVVLEPGLALDIEGPDAVALLRWAQGRASNELTLVTGTVGGTPPPRPGSGRVARTIRKNHVDPVGKARG